ncbi:hypothetical protein F0344_11485 [Streptomyces finlayi]|uniref:Ricin B lectin domain-containing protein n=1 Tax=Streptomyces finlayi TaxID=67296 RepID=A0A7G7BII2_9ACTN|nr:hypothetical protein [Streptomyces finlayi]QNE75147.1 hypothetical protein F0344_11485 [Streptomyces finlayi]
MKLRSAIKAAGTIAAICTVGIATASPAAAITYETNHAVKQSVSPSWESPGWWNQSTVGSYNNAMVAFQSDGDKWWLLDGLIDGKSVAVKWWNYSGGQLIRQGVCISSNGAPSWAVCNKDYIESSEIYAQACLYDGDTGLYSKCNTAGFRFRADGTNT